MESVGCGFPDVTNRVRWGLFARCGGASRPVPSRRSASRALSRHGVVAPCDATLRRCRVRNPQDHCSLDKADSAC